MAENMPERITAFSVSPLKSGGYWSTGPQPPMEAIADYIRADLVDDLRKALVTFQDYGCPVCHGDCSSANPPVYGCPMQQAEAAIARIDALKEK